MDLDVPVPRGFIAMFSGLMRAEALAEMAGERAVTEACARARREFIALFAQAVMPNPLLGFKSPHPGCILVPVERDDVKSFA